MIKGKLADRICDDLMQNIGGVNTNEVLIPGYYYTRWEMDLFRLTKSEMVVEYEVKISRSDFHNDFKKKYETGNWGSRIMCSKHEDMINKNSACNRFFFVMPLNLIAVDEIPSHAGLIYYDNGRFTVIKPAPLIHKKKATECQPKLYEKLARLLAVRSSAYRHKLRKLKISISKAKR